MDGALARRIGTDPGAREEGKIMTQHSSLKASGSKSKQRRNVLKRPERIKLLRDKGKWKEEDRVYGLPKVKPEG